MRYLLRPRDWIFEKRYRFLCFAKNKGKNTGKNISENLSGKYSQNRLDHVKQPATNTLKELQKEQYKKQ